jgi:hypothetical protein
VGGFTCYNFPPFDRNSLSPVPFLKKTGYQVFLMPERGGFFSSETIFNLVEE